MADRPDRKVLKRIPDRGTIDRLSALPDCVLLYILSHFETKDAAATSILSTRWRDLFVSLPNIDLSFCVDNDASDRDKRFSDFIHFANRVIGQRNKAPVGKILLSVEHFVERCKLDFESLLISAAATMSFSNVHAFRIWVSMDKTAKRFSMSIPPGIFTCCKLVSLSLDLGMDWTVPNSVCLPNLKFLDLKKFRLVDEESIQKFLQGCPLLEQLILTVRPFSNESEGEEGIEFKVLDISSPSLKRLMLCWHEKVELEFTIVVKSENLEYLLCLLEGKHKLSIDAPNITSLNIIGHVLKVKIIQKLVSIEDAVVQSDFLYYVRMGSDIFSPSRHAFEFVRGLQNVKSISLSDRILIALYFSQRVLPTFRKLIKLQLSPFDCPAFPRECMRSLLSSLSESFPNLEVLIFSEVSKNYLTEDEELVSVIQEALPVVLVEQLKKIEIRNFKGEEHELKLVEYFLKSAKSLKKMALFGKACASSSEALLDRILSFKKCSEDCQVVSKGKWDWVGSL